MKVLETLFAIVLIGFGVSLLANTLMAICRRATTRRTSPADTTEVPEEDTEE